MSEALYARAGIDDDWILDLGGRVLEVYRKPVADGTAPFRWRYRSAVVLGPGQSVSPLAIPRASVAVADLLP